MDTSSSTFFHRHISGTDAERLLNAEGKDGSFLIRPSQSNPGDFSLSVLQNNSVTHVKIQNRGDHYDLYGGDEFASLGELVQHYMEGRAQLMESKGTEIFLKQPLYLTLPSAERWYHGPIDGKEAEAVLLHASSQSKDEQTRNQWIGYFLVRDSLSKPGEFVISVLVTASNVEHVRIEKTRNGKYTIGAGTDFLTLNQLIDNYRSLEIAIRGGVNIILKQALNMSKIKASDIGLRVVALEKQFEIQGKRRDGFWEEFQRLEQMESITLEGSPRNVGRLPENRKKNRYKNILPFDASRVVLHIDFDPADVGSDYINANYIKIDHLIPGVDTHYIASQGCMDHTMGDFWRMVWQENTRVIVMATQTVEIGKRKCAQYWPDDEEPRKTFTVHRSTIQVKRIQLLTKPDYQVSVLEVRRDPEPSSDGVAALSEVRTVYHYQYMSWPDKHAPGDSGPILAFLDDLKARQRQEKSNAPIIAHCSAGIGRTGTLILIDFVISEIRFKGASCEIDISYILSELRRLRSGIVQTESQYQFVYVAVRHFVESLGKQPVGECLYSNEPKKQNEPIEPNLYENLPAVKIPGKSSSVRNSSKPKKLTKKK